MTDTDSYLLKCTLESIDAGVSLDKIQEKCKCQMGFVHCETDNNNY